MRFLEHVRIFVRVTELSSFTKAADSLGLPKATVSNAVQQLENRLGVRLLHRTTRKVSVTHDGQVFYERSKDTLSDMDELQNMFHLNNQNSLKGRVRLDMSTVVARQAVLPRLPEILSIHPQLEIEISSTERRVDIVREGFDCVVRAGKVTDQGLIARHVGDFRMVNCASKNYVKSHGKPNSIHELTQHKLIHYAATLGSKLTGFDCVIDNKDIAIPMQGSITVNNAEAYHAACLADLGLIQVPFVCVRALIESGELVEVLEKLPAPSMPVSLVYANRRNLSTRVRAVMDWLNLVLIEYLEEKVTESYLQHRVQD